LALCQSRIRFGKLKIVEKSKKTGHGTVPNKDIPFAVCAANSAAAKHALLHKSQPGKLRKKIGNLTGVPTVGQLGASVAR
jgi:hypothetical protein